MSSKAKKAKRVRSTAKQGAKKVARTGAKQRRKASQSQPGRQGSTSQRKSGKPTKPSKRPSQSSKRKPIKSAGKLTTPATEKAPKQPQGRLKPGTKIQLREWKSAKNATKAGAPEVIGKLKLDQPKGERPALPLIKRWIAKRKHVEFWRERDGSYHALVTFKGVSCFSQLERAFFLLPIPAYFALRFFRRIDPATIGKKASPPLAIRLKTGGVIFLEPFSSPTSRASAENFGKAKSWVFDGDTSLYMRKCGLAVSWPSGKDAYK